MTRTVITFNRLHRINHHYSHITRQTNHVSRPTLRHLLTKPCTTTHRNVSLQQLLTPYHPSLNSRLIMSIISSLLSRTTNTLIRKAHQVRNPSRPQNHNTIHTSTRLKRTFKRIRPRPRRTSQTNSHQQINSSLINIRQSPMTTQNNRITRQHSRQLTNLLNRFSLTTSSFKNRNTTTQQISTRRSNLSIIILTHIARRLNNQVAASNTNKLFTISSLTLHSRSHSLQLSQLKQQDRISVNRMNARISLTRNLILFILHTLLSRLNTRLITNLRHISRTLIRHRLTRVTTSTLSRLSHVISTDSRIFNLRLTLHNSLISRTNPRITRPMRLNLTNFIQRIQTRRRLTNQLRLTSTRRPRLNTRLLRNTLRMKTRTTRTLRSRTNVKIRMSTIHVHNRMMLTLKMTVTRNSSLLTTLTRTHRHLTSLTRHQSPNTTSLIERRRSTISLQILNHNIRHTSSITRLSFLSLITRYLTSHTISQTHTMLLSSHTFQNSRGHNLNLRKLNTLTRTNRRHRRRRRHNRPRRRPPRRIRTTPRPSRKTRRSRKLTNLLNRKKSSQVRLSSIRSDSPNNRNSISGIARHRTQAITSYTVTSPRHPFPSRRTLSTLGH